MKKEKFIKYEIVETIPKYDGTKVYVLNGIPENQPYAPFMTIVKELFKGTREECEKKIERIKR